MQVTQLPLPLPEARSARVRPPTPEPRRHYDIPALSMFADASSVSGSLSLACSDDEMTDACSSGASFASSARTVSSSGSLAPPSPHFGQPTQQLAPHHQQQQHLSVAPTAGRSVPCLASEPTCTRSVSSSQSSLVSPVAAFSLPQSYAAVSFERPRVISRSHASPSAMASYSSLSLTGSSGSGGSGGSSTGLSSGPASHRDDMHAARTLVAASSPSVTTRSPSSDLSSFAVGQAQPASSPSLFSLTLSPNSAAAAAAPTATTVSPVPRRGGQYASNISLLPANSEPLTDGFISKLRRSHNEVPSIASRDVSLGIVFTDYEPVDALSSRSRERLRDAADSPTGMAGGGESSQNALAASTSQLSNYNAGSSSSSSHLSQNNLRQRSEAGLSTVRASAALSALRAVAQQAELSPRAESYRGLPNFQSTSLAGLAAIDEEDEFGDDAYISEEDDKVKRKH